MKQYVNILKYAMEMEKQGYEFFKSNAAKITSASGKEMFEKLAEIEVEHYKFLEEHVKHIEETNSIKEVDVDIDREKNIFEERADKELLDHTLAESMAPELTILRTAYLMEKDFAEYYRNAADHATDEEAKKLFMTLATWEEGHENLFKTEYDRSMKEYMNQPWGG